MNVSAENQSRADERIPFLLDILAKHKWVKCALLIGAIKLGKNLASELVDQVVAGGENCDGCRL